MQQPVRKLRCRPTWRGGGRLVRSLWKQRPTEKSVLCPTRRLTWKMPFVQTKNDANGDVDEERGLRKKMQFYPTTSVQQKNYIVRQINGALILWASRPALASVVVSRLSRPIICCIFNFSRFSCFNLNFPILCGGVEVEPILCPLLDERSQ